MIIYNDLLVNAWQSLGIAWQSLGQGFLKVETWTERRTINREARKERKAFKGFFASFAHFAVQQFCLTLLCEGPELSGSLSSCKGASRNFVIIESHQSTERHA